MRRGLGVGLLLIVVVASAGCGDPWILWGRPQSAPGEPHPIEHFATRRACEAVLDRAYTTYPAFALFACWPTGVTPTWASKAQR